MCVCERAPSVLAVAHSYIPGHTEGQRNPIKQSAKVLHDIVTLEYCEQVAGDATS